MPGRFDTFETDCDLMGAQRHLKVLGIFARLKHRDGKDRYLADMPRVLEYTLAAARRVRVLFGEDVCAEPEKISCVAARCGRMAGRRPTA